MRPNDLGLVELAGKLRWWEILSFIFSGKDSRAKWTKTVHLKEIDHFSEAYFALTIQALANRGSQIAARRVTLAGLTDCSADRTVGSRR